jgi:hypothetical protein
MVNGGFPKTALIIRHAEKPADRDDRRLSDAGRRRAAMLADELPLLYPELSVLFATAVSAHSDRPLETIQPLAVALGRASGGPPLPIDTSFGEHDGPRLAERVLDRSDDLAGKVVLICWHHETIPELACALGATAPPEGWPEAVFDQIWQLDFGPIGEPTLAVRQQPVVPAP